MRAMRKYVKAMPARAYARARAAGPRTTTGAASRARRSGHRPEKRLPVDDVLVGGDAVHPAVVALADLAAEDREEQRDEDRRRAGDRAAGRERVVADRDPREVQALEDVVLRAADRGQCRDDDRGEDRPEPHADALARAVEPGHAAGDVAAAEPRDGEDHEQGDAAAEPDLLRCVRVAGVVRRHAERDAGADQCGGQDRGEADRAEPAEEIAAPLEPAEAVALAGLHRVERGGGQDRPVSLHAVVDAVAVQVAGGSAAGRRAAGRRAAGPAARAGGGVPAPPSAVRRATPRSGATASSRAASSRAPRSRAISSRSPLRSWWCS